MIAKITPSATILSLLISQFVSGVITTYGIIVYSEKPTSTKQAFNYGDDDELDDFAQSDYEAIYSRIVELNPSLKPFVDYVRSVIPPQRNQFLSKALIHL